METVLTVRELSKSYRGVRALEDFSLQVKGGETVGLLGHNGAGKTTAIECILGVRKPEKGTVEILGMDPLASRKRLFQRVGVQFQEGNYQTKIRVCEICEVTASLYRNPADWKMLLKTFGLGDKSRRGVYELSGGERQRLSVLLALIPKPELVFLDELTTGLDPKARHDVWKYLGLLRQQGLTVVLTSHYMDEVEALCDRILILKKGETAAQGSPGEIINGAGAQNLEEAYLFYSGEEREDESL